MNNANDLKMSVQTRRGFTLIELLVVIAVIALLAAMIFPVTGAVNRAKIRSKARTEVTAMENMIQGYKDKLGHYPPMNPSFVAFRTPLYYELSGATYNPATQTYQTLDKNSSITAAELKAAFGVEGLVNASQGDSDEGRSAQRFTTGLKPAQVAPMDVNQPNGAKLLVSAVGWKNMAEPMNPLNPTSNPFFYNGSNPTNNPNSFDLWVDVVIGTKTNRISNWSREPLIIP